MDSTEPLLLNEKNIQRLLEDIDTFIFDCDGVLWHGTDVIPGAKETIEKLQKLGKLLLFVTNNSTKSTKQYEDKFRDLGFCIDANTVYGTASVTALHLKNVLQVKKRVYMIGNQGMKLEIENCGIDVIGLGPDPVRNHASHTISEMVDTTLNEDVEAVVVGFDSHFNLQKLATAMLYLQEEGMPYIATNTDAQFPLPDGRSLPGTGSIVASVSVASGRSPVVLGKPERTMFEAIATVHDVNPQRTMMIGDRLDTDIQFGRNCGLKTLCVLSGVTKLHQLTGVPFDSVVSGGQGRLMPDLYTPSIEHLGKHLLS